MTHSQLFVPPLFCYGEHYSFYYTLYIFGLQELFAKKSNFL